MATLTINFDDALTDRILEAHGTTSLQELEQTIGDQLVERTKDYEVKQTELAENVKRKLADDQSRQLVEAKIAAVAAELKLVN